MLKTEAIKKWLTRATSPLAELYNHDMEVQVNVAQDGHKKVSGFGGTPKYLDEETGNTHSSFRIPYNANTDPNYEDREMPFSMERADAIGMTGWNWKNKKTMWVGFDFDSLIGHAEGVGITEEKLDELVNKCRSVPYIHLYRSTSGSGYHLYIFFKEGIPTNNHNEHSAIAHSLISLLTIDTGFDFQSNVDCMGMILWVWARRQEGTTGLQPVFTGGYFPEDKIPINWRDFIKAKGKKSSKLKRFDLDQQDLIESTKSAGLDDSHRAVLKWFNTHAERTWWYVPENRMLVCHTLDLKLCHEQLKLLGFYETISEGGSPEQNAFAFPMKKGSWVIRRYSKKTHEHSCWEIDEDGWTRTSFNIPPTFDKSCVYREGVLDSSDFYTFKSNIGPNLVFKDLVIDYQLKEEDFEYMLKKKADKIIIRVDKPDKKMEPPQGFLVKKSHFEIVLRFKEAKYKDDPGTAASDEIVRHCNSQGSDAGWCISVNGNWVVHPKSNVGDVVQAMSPTLTSKDIKVYFGTQITKPWILENIPFGVEYPGGRKWNRGAAQLSYDPKIGPCESWFSILYHIGGNLDEAVEKDEWCKKHNIESGAEYLLTWIALMIKRPHLPLPYLFLWGGQDTGKSTLHEALALLFKNEVGYVRADHALKSQTGFNKELETGVLCVVEETNLSGDSTAANRIKDLVTSLRLSIRAMQTDAYMVRNTTHWIQTSNPPDACPILKGDTRILSIKVPSLKDLVPKSELMELLDSQGPAFTNVILELELPSPCGRLGLPCLLTESKQDLMEANFTLLDRFIDERCYHRDGHVLLFSDFYTLFDLFVGQIDGSKRQFYTKKRVGLEFPEDIRFPKGKAPDRSVGVGNMSLTPSVVSKSFKYILEGSNLKEAKIG